MKFLILCILLMGCSKEHNKDNSLPIYSDMGAAEDAGKVK
jgi:hypothetical protein